MEERRGVVPSRRGRAVDGFWWRHPTLTHAAAAVALLWGVGYLVWRVGWSGAGIPGWLFWQGRLHNLGWLVVGAREGVDEVWDRGCAPSRCVVGTRQASHA